MATVTVQNTTSGLSAKTLDLLESDQTITGQKTFDRDPSAPFVVTSGSAVVTNLDADKLDGRDETAFAGLADTETVTGSWTFTPAPQLTAGFKERGRTTPAGEWTAPAFSAGAYTASGSMTWTVGSGDVSTYAYTLVGKTLTVTIAVAATTVGGSLDTLLKVAIPGSFTAARSMITSCVLSDNGTPFLARMYVLAGGTVINIDKQSGANMSAATDATAVQGQITFEVS